MVFPYRPPADLHKLARNVFMLGDVNGDLEHSTRFVLIDKQGRGCAAII